MHFFFNLNWVKKSANCIVGLSFKWKSINEPINPLPEDTNVLAAFSLGVRCVIGIGLPCSIPLIAAYLSISLQPKTYVAAVTFPNETPAGLTGQIAHHVTRVRPALY